MQQTATEYRNNNTAPRILLVEDDRDIVRSLTEYLRGEGFEVVTASGQREALDRLSAGGVSLVLLDISLSDGNGFAVCSAVKTGATAQIPVIFLTASGDEYSTVTGFSVGADDYVQKPFSPRELVFRIRNALRRYGASGAAQMKIGDVTVDTQRASVTRAGSEILLSALEYRLLLMFLSNRGTLLTRDRILSEIWDVSGEFVNDNTLTVYIKRLREKIGDDQHDPQLIKTVRGMGYKAE